VSVRRPPGPARLEGARPSCASHPPIVKGRWGCCRVGVFPTQVPYCGTWWHIPGSAYTESSCFESEDLPLASSGVLTMVGTSRIAITPTGQIKEHRGRVSVPGRLDYMSTSSPRRIMHAGYMALGYHAVPFDTATVDFVMYWMYLPFEYWDFVLPAATVFGDSLWFHMLNGVTARIELFW